MKESPTPSLPRAALDALPAGIVVLDESGTIIDVNHAWSRFVAELGVEPADLGLGCVYADGMGPLLTQQQSIPDLPRTIRRVLEEELDNLGWEYTLREDDGSAKRVLVRMNRVPGAGRHVVVSHEDITALRTAEEALRESEDALAESEDRLRHAQRIEAIGTLAGGVAHDFNNLLSVMFSYADSLQADLPDDEYMREDLAGILGAAERAASLTRQLLAFSSRQVLKPETTTVNRIVANIEKMLRRLIREDIEMTVELGDGPDPITVDAGQIEQVVMNLVVNAVDAMPEGGTLRISTGRRPIQGPEASRWDLPTGTYASLEVVDSGHGMDEKTKAHIFEPFFTTKGLGRGTGLGLATVFGIVNQSEGAIEVHTAVGEGTRFQVLLPVSPQTHQATTDERAPSAEVSGVFPARSSILVVEDDPALRFALRRALARAGYQVTVAGNGQEALDATQDAPEDIDVLLTDVVMPVMDGPSLADELRAAHPELKTIFMTGYTDNPATRRRLAEQTAPVIIKPFSPDDLLRAVAQVVT
jgi:PAS domain S-box-containing protein